MEKTSIQLGEALTRLNDGSVKQHAAPTASKDEPVDAEITRITIAQLKQMEAELHYWEEEDEFPSEYAKALKTVVREKGHLKEGDEDAENDAYMEKLAQNVEV